MLTAVSMPANLIEGEILKRTLADNGIRSTLAITQDGPRVMVWPEDEEKARDILKRRR